MKCETMNFDKKKFLYGAKLALSSTHFRYDMQHLQENWYKVTRKEKSNISRLKVFWNHLNDWDYKMISTKKHTLKTQEKKAQAQNFKKVDI